MCPHVFLDLRFKRWTAVGFALCEAYGLKAYSMRLRGSASPAVCSSNTFLQTHLVGYGRRPGTPVVPFFPFNFGVSFLKQNIRKEGTLIIQGHTGEPI